MGRSPAKLAAETETKDSHDQGSLAPAKATMVAAVAPTPNGRRKNAPVMAISPMTNSAAAPSQIQRQTSGSIGSLLSLFVGIVVR